MARVLIAGCGVIGVVVGDSLVKDGHEVYGLKRHPPTGSQAINYIKADLSRSEDLQETSTSFDLVIYILSPDDRSEQSYRKVFEHGLNNLVKVLSRQTTSPRYLFISSTSVYGQINGEWVDEESPTQPARTNGKIILQAEQTILANHRRNCVIRFSGIYGRGENYLFDAVIENRKVQFQPPYYMNRIHWQDCVRVINMIANKMLAGENLEPIYLASDDDPAPKWDVFSYLASVLGAQPPQKAVLSQDAVQNKRCSNRRLKGLGLFWRPISSFFRGGFRYVISWCCVTLKQESGRACSPRTCPRR